MKVLMTFFPVNTTISDGVFDYWRRLEMSGGRQAPAEWNVNLNFCLNCRPHFVCSHEIYSMREKIWGHCTRAGLGLFLVWRNTNLPHLTLSHRSHQLLLVSWQKQVQTTLLRFQDYAEGPSSLAAWSKHVLLCEGLPIKHSTALQRLQVGGWPAKEWPCSFHSYFINTGPGLGIKSAGWKAYFLMWYNQMVHLHTCRHARTQARTPARTHTQGKTEAKKKSEKHWLQGLSTLPQRSQNHKCPRHPWLSCVFLFVPVGRKRHQHNRVNKALT